jgi:hypothetical protein
MLAKRGAAAGKEATAGFACVRATLATAFATDLSSPPFERSMASVVPTHVPTPTFCAMQRTGIAKHLGELPAVDLRPRLA